MECARASSTISPKTVVIGAPLSALEGSSGIDLRRGSSRGDDIILQSRREGVKPAKALD
jgi:hypothetical protein